MSKRAERSDADSMSSPTVTSSAPGSDTYASEAAAAPPSYAPAPEPKAAQAERAPSAGAPSTTDARARYARADVQLSEARRELDVATSQRDCASACRALDSMERAVLHVCELAQSADERKTCASAEDQVGAARQRVRSACGDCPKKSR
ncbi:MAG TPA: hypothetical protein VJT73_15470 [Polyangiaceae bacterium]|nr:hypothetical protein [Polyangiaceae bacterium]